MQPAVAVLTGDLVASRDYDANAVDRAISCIGAAAAAFGDAWSFDPRFTRFRGDGWQILLPETRYVLDACIYIHARIKARKVRPETRISAGIGMLDRTGSRDLSDAAGPAFVVSGSHLDMMPRKRRMVIAGQAVTVWQAAVFDMVEWTIGTWTATQAEAVATALLMERTNEEMAAEIGITRQAFESRLNGAGYSALDNALAAFRTHDFTEGRDR